MPQPGSTFTFAEGNARKLLGIPLYLRGALAARVARRDPRLWVFGSGAGVGEGALALYRHARAVGDHDLLWLTGSDAEDDQARELGIAFARKDSREGYRATLRAGVAVVTHGLGDVNRYATDGAFVVQLWHGIPLKHIQLDSAVTFSAPGPLRGLLRRAYRRSAQGYRLVPAASEVSAARLRTAFGLSPDRVVTTGDPRDDVVLTRSRDEAREHLETLVGPLPQHVVLYAPTWRDGATDPTIPTAAEWQAIDGWLAAHDAVLLVRPHPHGLGAYAEGLPERARLLSPTAVRDVTPLLPGIDRLITDYSSIAFDFALLGRPIAFLAPDVDRYTHSRGLYEPYRRFSGGTEAATWAELLERLADDTSAHARRLAATHHSYRDGRNTARVYDEIITRLEGTRMAPSVTAGTPARIVAAEVAGDALRLSGPAASAPALVELLGSRVDLTAAVTVDGDLWQAEVPLRVARWGGPALAAPAGRYELRLTDSDGTTTAAPLPAIDALVPGLVRLASEGPVLLLSAPLTDDERGAANQARLEAEYRSARPTAADAVFFESFYGQNASCNPRAIDAAVARLAPGTARYWSVVAASVAVPDGAVPIIEGSRDWWRVRGEARVLVVNDWLRKRYRARPRQTVLQTWHGTMLKTIANDRPGQSLRAKIASVLESRRWDVLLSQNDHSTRVLRRAYGFRGPVWQEGYPRDDVLTTPDGAEVRRRLGIDPDTTVVLYAPTWRDDRLGHVDHIDVAAFTDALGPGHVTLIRGHSRTLRVGQDVRASNVIDVTGYPDVADLYLAADVLITDYSSVMFDYSVTGKPILFFTPDLEHYRERLRGFYFDLLAEAPGPVVQEPAQLVTLVQQREAVAGEYADRYAAWRDRFNPRDDGHASDRIVQRLIDLGAIRA